MPSQVWVLHYNYQFLKESYFLLAHGFHVKDDLGDILTKQNYLLLEAKFLFVFMHPYNFVNFGPSWFVVTLSKQINLAPEIIHSFIF